MTLRAVTLGIVAAVAIAALTYLNDWVYRLYWLVANHLPVSVYGAVLLVVLGLNPLLRRLQATWAFDRRELAVMVALALVGAGLGGAGLLRNFPTVLAAMLQRERTDVTWQRTAVLDYVPPAMLPEVTDEETFEPTLGVLRGGLRSSAEPHVSLRRVPWEPWHRTLAVWGPLILLTLGGMIALGLILHRQWSDHERLRYPIAEFATALIDTDRGRWPAVFRAGGFWIALAAVGAVHLVNGLAAWKPNMVQVPMYLDLSAVGVRWPGLTQGVGAWDVLHPELYISAAAFVFFMRSEVGLSLGISAGLMMLVSAWLIGYGVDFAGNQAAGGYREWLSFGAYVGFVGVILYTGRHHFALLARRAVGLARPSPEAPPASVWAMRAFVLCMVGLGGLLGWLSDSWLVGGVIVVLLVVQMVVVARISAEAGLFHIGLIWSPLAVLLGLLGATAAGPTGLLVAGLVGGALLMDPRETMLPFVVNSLRLCENVQAPVGRTTRWMAVALLLALPAGLGVTMWAMYNWGLSADNWSTAWVPGIVVDTVAREVDRMGQLGLLTQAVEAGDAGRLAAIAPEREFLLAAGLGLAGVLALGAARLRWTWWPLHPVLLVVAGTWAMQKLAASILLGWLVRTALVRLGGAHRLEQVRPAIIGLIVGDLLGALAWSAVGALYAAATGLRPPIYNPYTG